MKGAANADSLLRSAGSSAAASVPTADIDADSALLTTASADVDAAFRIAAAPTEAAPAPAAATAVRADPMADTAPIAPVALVAPIDPLDPTTPAVTATPVKPAGPPPSDPPVEPEAISPAPDSRDTRRRRVVFQAAVSTSLLALLALGFAGYLLGLSRLQEQHSQAALYRTLSGQLGLATAPTGPTADGAPMAVVDIPAIGLHQAVVVEGTTGSDLARGPGHLRTSVYPGQDGVSVLFGRRAAFGGPFAHLPALRVGDKISITTGQGVFSYTVNAYGTPAQPIKDPATARLLLVTGDTNLFATHAVYVGARLDGTPLPRSVTVSTAAKADQPLAVDNDALQGAQLWALAFLIAVAGTVVLTKLWHPRAAYLTSVPVLAALVWCVYENIAVFLPNLT